MTGRVADLFSPERLRQNWTEGEKELAAGTAAPDRAAEAAGATAATASSSAGGSGAQAVAGQMDGGSGDGGEGAASPKALFVRLEKAARTRFQGPRAEGLRQMIEELGRKLETRFPPPAETAPDDKEKAALDKQIQTMLVEIEDLADALALGNRRP